MTTLTEEELLPLQISTVWKYQALKNIFKMSLSLESRPEHKPMLCKLVNYSEGLKSQEEGSWPGSPDVWFQQAGFATANGIEKEATPKIYLCHQGSLQQTSCNVLARQEEAGQLAVQAVCTLRGCMKCHALLSFSIITTKEGR